MLGGESTGQGPAAGEEHDQCSGLFYAPYPPCELTAPAADRSPGLPNLADRGVPTPLIQGGSLQGHLPVPLVYRSFFWAFVTTC